MRKQNEYVDDFGPYKLVIRYRDSLYQGVLWRSEKGKPAVQLISLTAQSLKEAKELIERDFYEERLQQVNTTGNQTVSDEAIVKAWMYLWPHMNENQKKMIQAQYHAPQRRMTATELAEIAGYKSYSGTNRWYGEIGFMFFGELPRELPIHKTTGHPIYSFAISTGVDQESFSTSKHWIWEMRPEIAKGLEIAGFVNPTTSVHQGSCND